MTLLVPVLLFVIGLVLQALFAGYETGFVSANPIRLRYLSENEQSTRAARLLHAIEHPDLMITALLIGTNVMVVTCTLSISTIVSALLPAYSGLGNDIISTAIVAPIMLIFSEILPKSVFRTHPTRLSLAFYPIINTFNLLLAPIALPISWASRALLYLFGESSHHLSPHMATLDEVRDLVDEGVDHGALEPEEQEMIHSVIDLQATTAKEIMKPRIDIQAAPDTISRTDLINLFVSTGRTRILIYHETIDSIVGVVNVYNVLADTEPEREDIARFIRPVRHVPDTIRVDDLFRDLKRAKQHIAVVTDEYGGTDGLVTIEDIVEEIFGEIQDEYDEEESPIQRLGPNAYVVDARMALSEVAEVTGVPIEDERVETIGGWLMHIAGHIPLQGQVVEYDRFRMTVLDGAANRVSRIRLDIAPEDKIDSSNATPHTGPSGSPKEA